MQTLIFIYAKETYLIWEIILHKIKVNFKYGNYSFEFIVIISLRFY